MFQGAAALNLDQKGRLAIPARQRDALAGPEGRLAMTAHHHGCLYVFPVAVWQQVREEILSKPAVEQEAASLRRLMIGYAREEELDAAGRVLVAPELRAWAGLDKQVWLIGQGRYLELWSDAGWRAQQAQMVEQFKKAVPAGYADLVL
jgi:MraZ protein